MEMKCFRAVLLTGFVISCSGGGGGRETKDFPRPIQLSSLSLGNDLIADLVWLNNEIALGVLRLHFRPQLSEAEYIERSLLNVLCTRFDTRARARAMLGRAIARKMKISHNSLSSGPAIVRCKHHRSSRYPLGKQFIPPT